MIPELNQNASGWRKEQVRELGACSRHSLLFAILSCAFKELEGTVITKNSHLQSNLANS